MAGQYKCVSSQYNIQVTPNSYAHQYDVEIVFSAERFQRTLTRGGNAFQKAQCRHILKNLVPLKDISYAYDGQAILWTSKELQQHQVHATFQMDNFLRDYLSDDGQLAVTLTFARSINLSDFSGYANGHRDTSEDRTLRNVMEMIISQNALEREGNNCFAAFGPGLMVETAEEEFDRGFVVRNGNAKGVHIVNGSSKPQPLLAINALKKISYPSNANFLEVLRTFMANRFDYAEAERAFRGVKLQLMYLPGKTFTFGKFSPHEIRDTFFEDDQQQTNVVDYFADRYGITLRYGNYRGAMTINGNAIFPLEQLRIIPDQGIPDSRLPEALREAVLKINRLSPEQRYNSINDQFRKLEVNNRTTKGFGIQIREQMTEGTFTRLSRPTIIARNKSHLHCNDFGKFCFDSNQYFTPGRIDRFVVLSSARDERTSMECARAVVQESRRKGVYIPEMIPNTQQRNPQFVEFNTRTKNMQDWMDILEQYKGSSTLVTIVDVGTESHSMIKVAEAKTGVATQHLLWKTANSICQKPQTLENISHKINLKGGGLNHIVKMDQEELDLSKGNVLVIGVDVCHPTGEQRRGDTSEPSVAAITGNYLRNPFAFSGTFFFQPPRQESLDSAALQAYTTKMLNAVPKDRKIDTIVLCRDGVSEGQYAMVKDIELVAIGHAAAKYNSKMSIIGLVVTKTGNVRHFNRSSGSPASLPCRSVIPFGVTNDQFYMIPHRAPQGLAKAVLTTVLRNDRRIPNTAIQRFLMALTSLHQIVCSPISLPEPIYQADKLAARGQLLFRAFLRSFPNQVPREINYPALTRLISFNGGSLPHIRYTA